MNSDSTPITRRTVLRATPGLLLPTLSDAAAPPSIFLGQGTMSGEPTASSLFLQTRLTTSLELDAKGDLPGVAGVVAFEWAENEDFRNAQRTPFQPASPKGDFIVRAELNGLKPKTRYHYRAVYGISEEATQAGATCAAQTLPGSGADEPVYFIVGSCMNYNKFIHGKAGFAGNAPITATEDDKRLGFPVFATMRKEKPDFFVGTGDIVYYDNKYRIAETVPQLRRCWHEQFRFPRMIDFFRDVPAYWSKDDHDFRYNESDNSTDHLPLPQTGIDIFREQLPITSGGDAAGKTYRTHRVSKHLQIWLTEGRDYRSPNEMEDGPNKSLWGVEQREWLERTLKESDARWKILITPTPMVGPDEKKKIDNHADIHGFRHEADEFFQWLGDSGIKGFMTVCGDRHWQYHSIHPSGVEEFACGALNDENSRIGIAPGSPKGTDPQSLVKQPFTSPEPSGGFLSISAGEKLDIKFHTAAGKVLYQVAR